MGDENKVGGLFQRPRGRITEPPTTSKLWQVPGCIPPPVSVRCRHHGVSEPLAGDCDALSKESACFSVPDEQDTAHAFRSGPVGFSADRDDRLRKTRWGHGPG